jgi:hypothetical protein
MEYDDSPLFRRISASISEQRYQAWAYHNAPIRHWVNIHRYKLEQARFLSLWPVGSCGGRR